jgi:hypothetical protein
MFTVGDCVERKTVILLARIRSPGHSSSYFCGDHTNHLRFLADIGGGGSPHRSNHANIAIDLAQG